MDVDAVSCRYVAITIHFGLMEKFAALLGITIVIITFYKVAGSTWYMIEHAFRAIVLYVQNLGVMNASWAPRRATLPSC